METRVLSGVKLSQRAWLGKYLAAGAWTGHSLRRPLAQNRQPGRLGWPSPWPKVNVTNVNRLPKTDDDQKQDSLVAHGCPWTRVAGRHVIV